jgi:S-adenosylmethionine:tRNA ribosyltransferase-isomerase
MLVREFDFSLPPELIAQEPCPDRSGARLLHLSRETGAVVHTRVAQLPSILHEGDLLVVNDTRVFPARLLGRRTPSGGAVECLLIGRSTPDWTAGGVGEHAAQEDAREEWWDALVHPGQKLKPGARVRFGGSADLRGEILARRDFGRRLVRLWTEQGGSVGEAVEAIGQVPLPPYIKRPTDAADRERYQTVFADRQGSVAAPTAGLHFSSALVSALLSAGVAVVSITLHVGYGTFQPIRVDEVEQHRLESERYEIGVPAAVAIAAARREGRRVVAVGTTTTRTLEAVAREHDGEIVACAGSTSLFIYPGFEFRVISGLLTNFHLPQSSLLMLVSAFAGRNKVLSVYHQAIAERYRFYSYGDAMLVT